MLIYLGLKDTFSCVSKHWWQLLSSMQKKVPMLKPIDKPKLHTVKVPEIDKIEKDEVRLADDRMPIYQQKNHLLAIFTI
jgi:hypothetical protein